MATANATPAATEPSFAELRVMMDNAAKGIVEEPATTVAEPAAEPETPVAEAATAVEAETAPATDPVPGQDDPPRDDKGKFAKKDELPAGVQKRIAKEIGKATEARREAERDRAEAAQRLKEIELQGSRPAKETAPSAKVGKPPKIEDFATYDEYTDARASQAARQAVEEALTAERSRVEQTKLQSAQAQTKTDWQKSEADARQALPDYDEVVADIEWPQTPAVAAISDYIMSETNARLLYHLQKNPEEVQRISVMSPLRAVAELGKIEAAMTTKAPDKAPVQPQPTTAAPRVLPKPPVSVGGQPAPKEIDLEKADMPTFTREMIRLGIYKKPGAVLAG